MKTPHPLGLHRVIEPAGALPQAAWKLDNTPKAFANEILCDVEMLNLDSASFAQLRESCGDNLEAIAEQITGTVRTRGKQHNPVTGSGGMFVGPVAEIGEGLRHKLALHAGERIASLVSLTLTPLYLDAVEAVDLQTARVFVRGKAILFESAGWTKLPDDLDPGVALAVLDVAGAPAQIRRCVKPGMSVVVIGADGKSGMLVCAQARESIGNNGTIIGVVPDAATGGAAVLRESGLVDDLIAIDARDAAGLAGAIAARLPALADLVVNCVNVSHTEAGSILCAKQGGTVYFFSMNTSFTAATLGAEGMGKDVTLIMGNGFARDHAATALETLRTNPAIAAYFHRRYAAAQPARTAS